MSSLERQLAEGQGNQQVDSEAAARLARETEEMLAGEKVGGSWGMSMGGQQLEEMLGVGGREARGTTVGTG